ncbi:MAG: hypothetical protein Q7R93_02355 [bacterium]|nr:hypothetical protein [bacterium]
MIKKMSIDDLAGMVKRGFDETAKKTEMEAGFEAVNKRLDHIENLLIRAHDNRITALEDSMRLVKTKLGVR